MQTRVEGSDPRSGRGRLMRKDSDGRDRRFVKCPSCVRHFIGLRAVELYDHCCDVCGSALDVANAE